MTYNPDTNSLEGGEKDLTMHDGTVRDCCFVEEGSGGSTLLLSGGAGDCKVNNVFYIWLLFMYLSISCKDLTDIF
jgi:hypothetical protein